MSIQLKDLWDRMVACCHTTCPCSREKPGQTRDSADAVVIANPKPLVTASRVLPPLPSPVRLYTALWDYNARTTEDLSFRAGDQLEVIDQSSPDWWIARAVTGISAGTQGYIPANYVAPLESLHAER